MSSPKYCLDTHPLIWYFTGQNILSTASKQILDRVFSQKAHCFIPSIVLLEAFHVSLKNGKFNFPEFLKKIRLVNIIVVPLDKVVLSACYQLPKSLDIHDRVIAATAMVNNSCLITKDPQLRKIRTLKTTW